MPVTLKGIYNATMGDNASTLQKTVTSLTLVSATIGVYLGIPALSHAVYDAMGAERYGDIATNIGMAGSAVGLMTALWAGAENKMGIRKTIVAVAFAGAVGSMSAQAITAGGVAAVALAGKVLKSENYSTASIDAPPGIILTKSPV